MPKKLKSELEKELKAAYKHIEKLEEDLQAADDKVTSVMTQLDTYRKIRGSLLSRFKFLVKPFSFLGL